jgi:hypothetical protein
MGCDYGQDQRNIFVTETRINSTSSPGSSSYMAREKIRPWGRGWDKFIIFTIMTSQRI